MQGARPLGWLVGQAEGVAGNLVQAHDYNLRRRGARAAQLKQRAEPCVFLEAQNAGDGAGEHAEYSDYR